MGVFKIHDKAVEDVTRIPFKDAEGKNDETILESLIFEHPEIFPVNQIADANNWIPLFYA